jgi:hypothetical protein
MVPGTTHGKFTSASANTTPSKLDAIIAALLMAGTCWQFLDGKKKK